MHKKNPWTVAFAPLVLFAAWAVVPTVPAYAQSDSKAWNGLPDETIAAYRIPDGQALADAIMQTKFGKIMFSESRKARIVSVLESSDSEEWAELLDTMKEYEIELSDLLGLLSGESAYAVLLNNEDTDDPFFAGLGWFTAQPELTDKFYDLIVRLVDEQDEDENAVTRVDVTIADKPVMQLQFPSVSVEYEADFELGDDYDDLPEDEQEEAWDQANEAWENSAVETVHYRTVLVSKNDGRLVIAHTFKSADEDGAGVAYERLGKMLGQFLLGARTGEGGNFVSRVTAEPGAARVMSLEGLPTMELLGDLAPLVELMQKSAESNENAAKISRMLGAEDLGALAVRSTVDGSAWRTSMSFAMPAPRRGLMRIFDQEHLAVEPPQWVPASAVRYYQVSFDLAKAYEIIKEEVIRAFPDQAAQGFTTVEMQVQNFVQTSLTEILSSLGNRHTVVTYGFEGTDDTIQSQGDASTAAATERVAIVWELEDEELWTKLFQVIGPFAGMAPGAEATEEQGFSGWRMKNGATEGGLFLGKGYLVVGIGSNVVETTLSSLNNPPKGSDALLGSSIFARAGELLDLKPATVAQITDGDRYMEMSLKAMKRQFKQMEVLFSGRGDSNGSPSGIKLMSSLAEAILPADKELKGIAGTIASRWEINDDGFFLESVQEMPAP